MTDNSYERELQAERSRQDAEFGPQHHPDVDQVLMTRPGGATAQRMAQEYEIPTARRARFSCDVATDRGQVTWCHIALEEFCEAVEAATIGTLEELYGELTQLEAVIRNWREDIRSREVS